MKTTPTHALARLALALAVTALVVTPHHSRSQACDDGAARNMLLSSRIESILQPADKEDVEFFTSRGGSPNVLIVLDTSGSMERLPPDGPHSLGFGGGAYTTANPVIGTDVPQSYGLNGGRSNNAQQTAALAASVAVRPTGCGLDPVSAAAANFMTHPQISSVNARRFSPPCPVEFVDAALENQPYQGQAVDYAAAMTICPRFVDAANPQQTGAPGFDPDYYVANNNLTGGGGVPGRTNFFPKDLVFHDNEAVGSFAYNNGLPFKHNFGDGWSDTQLFPATTSAGAVASITTFCDTFPGNLTMQGAQSRATICKQCLNTKGWWFDGISLTTTDNGINYGYPSLWYTGNYLSFFPPKFLVAKKVLKDLVATQTDVRMAINRFDSVGSAPYLAFAPTCAADAAGTNFQPSRQTFVTNINAIAFGGGTPLSRALFDGGRYFHTPTLPWFASTWESAAKESSGAADNLAICYACQASSIILMTDGAPNPPDGNGTDLPPGGLTAAQLSGAIYAGDAATGIQSIASPTCTQCSTFSGADSYMNNTAKVAFYLHNMDLRKNDETTKDCKGNGGKQTVDVYTVGFGTASLPTANQILQNTASAGGGAFVPAENTGTLKDAFRAIFQQINDRSTSFSTATVSTLQTTAGRSVIVPRFDPQKSNLWRGHLSRYDLFSEFVSNCVEDGAGTGVGDLDCDGHCQSVFLQDAAGDFISEDTSGIFRKNDPPNLPTCESAPVCQLMGRPCAVTGTAPATSWWDAGNDLASRAWKTRHVFSAVDSNGDGKIDQADGVFELDTSNDVAATKLVPYLGLGGKLVGPSLGSPICNALGDRLAGTGKLTWANDVRTSKVQCAKTMIRFLKGADLFNETGAASYATVADQESLGDRSFKLGDIFHSSPVVVDPPLPSKGFMCLAGASNQCIPSLWATPTPHEGGKPKAYDDFQQSAQYVNRRKVVLVGANDGLLHAFNGGTWRANEDDPKTSALDESVAPFNGYYERGNLSGGPEELWAFLPPGMIGKIPLLIGTGHQIYADGSPMVRDVWVDGTTNGLAGAAAADDLKNKQEFHTVAVVPLRRGGTHFFALDLTNATEPGQPPTFLWMFPQPNDKRVLAMGETYDSFLPRPPPIGPVRIKADANSGPPNANTPVYDKLVGSPPYHERWVAFLNGGFDPLYLRGRGVYMVDVWTGKLVWDFAYPDNPAAADPADPRLQLRYPIPATVGMVPWGLNLSRKFDEKNEWFFDTATFGDAGGQIWTLRYSLPGELDASGVAQNWFGGRSFQMGGSAACKLCGGQPFFYMSGNMGIGVSSYMRVYLGTGDRFNMLDQQPGGQCGPDNLRACALRGCTVTLDAANNYVGTVDKGTRSFSGSAIACGNLTQNQSDAAQVACSAKGSARIAISCPSPVSSTVKWVAAECANDEDGEYSCTNPTAIAGSDLTLSDTVNVPDLGNWFFSLTTFDAGNTRPLFTTAAEAKTYDSNRLFVTQAGAAVTKSAGITVMKASDLAPTGATEFSQGFAIYYDHGPTATASGSTFSVSWMDERTITGIGPGVKAVTWKTIQTAKLQAAAGACAKNKCAFENQRVSYAYNADPVTGKPVLLDASGSIIRAAVGLNFVPPQGDQATVFVNQKGQVQVALTSVSPERGALNVGASDAQDPVFSLGVHEVSEKTHACRHSWPGNETGAGAVPPTQEACR